MFRTALLAALAAVVALAAPVPAGAVVAPPVVAEPLSLRPDQRALLIAMLERAPEHGLPAVRTAAMSDQQLENAAIAHAAALRGQRMAGRFPNNWALRPVPYDAAEAFSRAFAADRLGAWAEGLAPRYAGYRELSLALARYRNIEAAGGWPELDAGPVLKPGARDPRIAELRRRIAVETDIYVDGADETLLDPALAQVLRREQARLGVPVTGELDKATVAAFNIPARARIATIATNLERWRWLPAVLPAYRVELNIPAAGLAVWRGGEVVLAMRAIVGRKATPTPSFLDEMETVVLNPPWNVPASIARNEILPKAARDPGYLARHNYVRLPGGGLQQRPGPNNALGFIKFDLPNRFAVYLHDTPARTLFARDERALSHGCMRVEKPLELAALVLSDQPQWNTAAIEAAIAARNTQRVPLQARPAVLVVYRTAFVEDGQVQFRKDVYGWDEKLAGLLER